jgi:hypothetical protein
MLDKEFYYRSCPFYASGFVGQSFDGIKEILHPTTFYDVGVRDEFLNEICVDPKVDPSCSVVRDISTTSYQDPGNILEYAINYRLDINNGTFDVDDFFSGRQYGSNIEVFDGDVTQLMSINCETGIEAFDIDTPHYFMFNGELMDPESGSFDSYFKGGGSTFGPTPIDLKFDNNGAFVRSCLNYRLGDYSQTVPFYLWDKHGTGFGSYLTTASDDQMWDKTAIASRPLQRLFSIGDAATPNITNYIMDDGEEEYLLKPITITHPVFWFAGDYEDSLERFETISFSAPVSASSYIEGDLWLQVLTGTLSDPQTGYLWTVVNEVWVNNSTSLGGHTYSNGIYETFVPQTVLNYSGNKQVLSTPFLFYFGLKPGKTSLDRLIKYFGPKGAFGTDEIACVEYDLIPVPSFSPTPTPTTSPGSPPMSSTPTPTPTMTPLIVTTEFYIYNGGYHDITDVLVHGISLPGFTTVTPGNSITCYTTQTGTDVVSVVFSGNPSPSEKLALQTIGFDVCIPNPDTTQGFIGVPINGNPVTIHYDDIECY